MKPSTIIILAVAALLFIGGAVYNSSGVAFTSSTGGALLFPGLDAHVNDIARITLDSGGKKLVIDRGENEWVVASKENYPAKFDVVKQTIVGLADERTVEAKTAEPSLYPRLEVEDPGPKAANSTLLTVEDGKGAALASLIVGKKRQSRSGAGPEQVYVRKPGEARSWLAEGPLERVDGWKAWVDNTILTVERDLVRQIDVAPADGKPYRITLDKPGEGEFALQDIPAGQQLKEGADLNAVGAALLAIKFDDVMPAKSLKPDAKLLRRLTYRSFDGIVVEVSEFEQDGKTWFKFAPSFDPKGAIAQPEPAKEKAEPKPKIAGVEVEENEPPKPKPAEEAKKSAEAMAARADGWVYTLEANDAAAFNKSLAELIEPKPPEQPGAQEKPAESKPETPPPAPPMPDKPPEQPK